MSEPKNKKIEVPPGQYKHKEFKLNKETAISEPQELCSECEGKGQWSNSTNPAPMYYCGECDGTGYKPFKQKYSELKVKYDLFLEFIKSIESQPLRVLSTGNIENEIFFLSKNDIQRQAENLLKEIGELND